MQENTVLKPNPSWCWCLLPACALCCAPAVSLLWCWQRMQGCLSSQQPQPSAFAHCTIRGRLFISSCCVRARSMLYPGAQPQPVLMPRYQIFPDKILTQQSASCHPASFAASIVWAMHEGHQPLLPKAFMRPHPEPLLKQLQGASHPCARTPL